MDLLDYLKPDELRGRLAAALRNMPVAQLARGELPTKQGLTDTLLAQKPFNAQDLTGAMEGANWANPMLAAKIVYHGSPHKFDKFDASKIGTGEGAQAYGHGVYLADAPDVARTYAADRKYVGQYMSGKPSGIDFDDPMWIAQKTLDEMGDAAKAKAHLEMVQRTAQKYQNQKTTDAVTGAIKLLEDGGVSPKGSLYKADLPDEWIPKMLDWDKPLSQQPENVRLLAKDLGLAKDATGKDVYSALSNQARDMGIIKGQNAQTTLPGSQSRAATDLSDFGIPGIRYLDGGSRPNSGRISMLEQMISNLRGKGASQAAIANTQRELDAELARASYNYVVFPGLEDKVKILERNGQPINPLADALRKYP